MTFADTFSFGRPNPAPYVDVAGVTRVAGADQPRFDHVGALRPRGLLVEPGAALGQQDRVALRPRDWSAAATWTVLHELDDGAAIRLAAHYTVTPEVMIDACLALAGWHRRIAAVPGYLVNYGGWVWALGARWMLPEEVATRGGRLIKVGGATLLAA